MSDIDISVGLTVGLVAGEPATFDDTGYEALTYITVGEVSAVPEFGGEGQIVNWIPLATGVVDKRSGSKDYGNITIPFAHVFDDVGQVAMESAFDGANAGLVHSFKLSHPSIGDIYFTGIVSSFKYNPGDANSIFQGTSTVAVATKPVKVEAA